MAAELRWFVAYRGEASLRNVRWLCSSLQGGSMKTGLRFRVVVLAILAVGFVGGCTTSVLSPSVTYSYEPRFSFAELKTYQWAEGKGAYWADPLLEANVRFLADRALQAKGFSLKADKADLLFGIRYEGGSANELRVLSINVYRADKNELVWRGTAMGAIRTDAASGDLRNAVEGMLLNFPPK
jgi:Domain of unknown function (DUF4136)